MIDTKVTNFGTNMNGWLVNAQPGVYGAEYLFRAAVPNLDLKLTSHKKLFIEPHLQISKEGRSMALTTM